MPIKTVSLETAKLLKEAGFRQDTEFCWATLYVGKPSYSVYSKEYLNRGDVAGYKIVDRKSAPTTDELFEELPSGINKPRIVAFEIRTYGKPKRYVIQYRPTDYRTKKDLNYCVPFEAFVNELLPEALAAMWIFLKKEVLLNGNK